MYKLKLYGTLGCHLCEEAEQWLAMYLPDSYAFDKIDIAESEQLVNRYGLRIPVLSSGIDECDWPFDAKALAKVMHSAQSDLAIEGEDHAPLPSRRVFHVQLGKE